MKQLLATFIFALSISFFCHSQSAEQFFQKGLELENSLKMNEAIRHYKLALEKDQNHKGAKDGLFKCLYAIVGIDLHVFTDITEALEYSYDLVEYFPDIYLSYLMRGEALYWFADESAPDKSERLDQDLGPVDQSNFKLAIIDLSKAILMDKDGNDPRAFYLRGMCYFNLKNYSLAISDYSKAILIEPKNEDALSMRALSRSSSGDYKGAIEDHNTLIQINPSKGLTYVSRGLAKQSLGDIAGACTDWHMASILGEKLGDQLYDKNCSK